MIEAARMPDLLFYARVRLSAFRSKCPFLRLDIERRLEPGGSVRGERANLKGLVLGCIEVKICK